MRSSSNTAVAPVWVLALTGTPMTVPASFHHWAAEWHDIAEREKRVGINVGTPVLVSRKRVDGRVNAYFRDAFKSDRTSTAQTYAIELKTWFAYLDVHDVRWDEARSEDVRAFQLWRVYDERNPARVLPSTWNKGWAALRHFYRWAEQKTWIDSNPVGLQDRLGEPTIPGGFREKNARGSRDRWLTTDEYSLWRDVGFRGYSAAAAPTGKIVAALPRPGFRARNIVRNAAFADFALCTGLREAEVGCLVDVEVPTNTDEQVPILGKGKVIRHFQVLHRIGTEAAQAYKDGERRDSIRRAQRRGLYDRITDPLVVHTVLGGGRLGQRFRLVNGETIDLATLPARDRQRLFRTSDRGIEPMYFWLTESGLPLPHTTWNMVFRSANDRVSKARMHLHVRSPWVNVTPHSLRFSFALMVLIANVRSIDEALGLQPTDVFDFRNYRQAFEDVRDLLGHSSTETTKERYLEPVKSLRHSAVFRGRSIEEVWAGIRSISPLVGFGDE